MKFKKMLSFMTAAAISASCMAGLYVVASADESETTDLYKVEAEKKYNAGDTLYNKAFTLKVTNNISTSASRTTDGFDATMVLRTMIKGDIKNNTEIPDIVDYFKDLGMNDTTQVTSIVFTPEYDGTAGIYITGVSASETQQRKLQIYNNTTKQGNTIIITTSTVLPATFDVKAGNDYIIYARGFTAYVEGAELKYTASTEPTDTPDPDATDEPTDAPTDAPTDTPKPSAKPANPVAGGIEGTTETLKAATETKTYDLRKPAADANSEAFEWGIRGAVYITGHLYFGNEILAAGTSGPMYYSDKGSEDLNGAPHGDGIRLKVGQDDIAVKLAAGATVETRVKGGGGGDRVAIISSTAPEIETKKGDLATSENLANYAVKDISYTNDTGAEKVVYLSATGDSFISQIKVTVPATEPTEQTATATGETFSNLEGDAAASFKTDAVNVASGTIKNPKWIITAYKNGSKGTATVDVTGGNTVGTTFTGADIVFGIVLKGVDTEQYSNISAQFVYTVE